MLTSCIILSSEFLLAKYCKFFAAWVLLVTTHERPSIFKAPYWEDPDYDILDSWVLENFKLADEPFAKALHILEDCVSVNNNLCGKLFSSVESPITFDEWFKFTLVPYFIPDFNQLGYELDNFTFIVLHWVILYWCYIKTK